MPFWGVFAGRRFVRLACEDSVSAVSRLYPRGARINRWISKSDTTAGGLALQVTGAYHFRGIVVTAGTDQSGWYPYGSLQQTTKRHSEEWRSAIP
jgi:hypothetical protein